MSCNIVQQLSNLKTSITLPYFYFVFLQLKFLQKIFKQEPNHIHSVLRIIVLRNLGYNLPTFLVAVYS